MYKRQWIGSTLVQVMACHLFNTKPYLIYRYKKFHSWKCIWKYLLWNGSHFAKQEMSWYFYVKLPNVVWCCNSSDIEAETKCHHFPEDIFKSIFLNENCCILIKIALKYVHQGPINTIPALVQIMAWHRPGDKPLSEPMMVTHAFMCHLALMS